MLAGSTRVWFNVSHSAQEAVIALTGAGPIGIDLQYLDPSRDPAALARRLLTDGESQTVRALARAQLPDAFLCCWTVKEAVLKALGTGVLADSTRVSVDPVRAPPSLREVPGEPGPEHWSIWHCRLGPRRHLAVALPHAGVRLLSLDTLAAAALIEAL